MPYFFDDLKAGTLPQFVLIQPRMATSNTGPSNWQHPDNSVEQGEILMTQIYTSLKASKYWEQTLWIITYDEHGGFFDHQLTPATGVPSPDGILSPDGFDYSRLGVRIPTVMVSPWIAKGTVVSVPEGPRAPTATSQYDSTSIISSANKLFGIKDSMTKRDAWAGTFHDIVSGTSGLRTNCPDSLPPARQLSEKEITKEMNMPLNDHHFDSINLLCYLSNHAHPVCADYAKTAALAADQAAFVASLGHREGTSAWTEARYPHLYGPAALLLRQKHFEGLSKFMFDVYKRDVVGQQATS